MYSPLIEKLLSAAMEAAPTDEIRANFTDAVYDMFHDGINHYEIAQTLAGVLADGLVHGNWPTPRPPRNQAR